MGGEEPPLKTPLASYVGKNCDWSPDWLGSEHSLFNSVTHVVHPAPSNPSITAGLVFLSP